MEKDRYRKIWEYHRETKHHFDRLARSPGYMDWENQPDPFRFYRGCETVQLPFSETDPPGKHIDLYVRKNNTRKPFTLKNIGGFLELSVGLSAWKGYGNSFWSLRMNPSSGNLHPTEVHLVLPGVKGIDDGVYHYNPLKHLLEKRAVMEPDLSAAILRDLGSEGFLAGVSSIFWRESWKYGERAYRYCNLDAGHVLAALSFSANLFGWRLVWLKEVVDDEIATVLGFDKTDFAELEEEEPDCLCLVCPGDEKNNGMRLSPETIGSFSELTFEGSPNRLSKNHVNWEIIYQTAEYARKQERETEGKGFTRQKYDREKNLDRKAANIIRSRRSAVSFDRSAKLSAESFFSLLEKTMPVKNCAPFDAMEVEPAVNLLLFVHNVDGLSSGLYFFIRTGEDVETFSRIFDPDGRFSFTWEPAESDFPLFLLAEENLRVPAAQVSCYQDIGGSGVFSLGMLSRFSNVVEQAPWRYRQLMWEAGMIGQVLYLEAESAGLRGTGIGCYFDDAVHEMIGLRDNNRQVLYHFTVGLPVEDERLTSRPPYRSQKK